MSATVQHVRQHSRSTSFTPFRLHLQGRCTHPVVCDPWRTVSRCIHQRCAVEWLQTEAVWRRRAYGIRSCTLRRKYTEHIRNSKAVAQCTFRGTAEEETATTSNGSSHAVDIVPAEAVKGNGSTIVPQLANGDHGGNGIGGSGGSGDGRGGNGNDSPDSDQDPQPKALLLLLTIVAGSTSLYGIYQLILAVGKLIERHSSKFEAKAAPRLVLSQVLQSCIYSAAYTTCRKPSCCRPHDDIAALKRLLREVFTSQLQMERRISALEPEKDVADPFDTLTRSRKGWQAMSSTGKAKVQLSGCVETGSAMLYSKASSSV